jgi:hypothetical protein
VGWAWQAIGVTSTLEWLAEKGQQIISWLFRKAQRAG